MKVTAEHNERIARMTFSSVYPQQVRFLDKLVDELAKGRKMEKILRVDKTLLNNLKK